MRKIFTVSLSILLISCLSETSVDPGSSNTFIRYFNGGNNDEARALELASDGGFIVLATTKIKKTEADIERTKIKVIKTDKFGNPLWQKLYPGFSVDDLDYLASSIQVNPAGGYVIIGDVIQTSGVSKVSKALVMTINEDGIPQDSVDLQFDPSLDEKGKAITVDAAGNFLALTTQGTSTMILTEINKDTFIASTPIAYSGGVTTLASRLIIDGAGKAVWSGTSTVGATTGIRLLKTIPNSPVVDFDLFYNEPNFSFAGFDFCRYGTGYAIGGATNQKPDGSAATDTDILYYQTDENGITLRRNSFPFDDPSTAANEDNQIDAGNAINATIDGGLIFLSTVNSAAIDGRGDSDFYLIKINAFGDREWFSSFGSKFKDEGVAIRQLSDSYYVALGTTTQGSLKILTLFKTDKNGKID